MRVVDLTEERRDLFCLCLEDWSDEAKEAGPKRCEWLRRNEKLGLRAKFALDDAGVEGGMIQYGPIEHSFVDGKDLYFVYCIFVHGYPQGRGDFRKRGMGRALLYSAAEDAKARGAKGLVVWGITLPFWMRASWFRKQGYRKADRQGIAELLWRPFTDDAEAPRWFPKSEALPESVPGKVDIVAFSSGWCLAQNLVYERVKRAAADFGDLVSFREIDTSKRENVATWGRSDVVLVDGKEVQNGPPPSYEKVRKTLTRHVRRKQREERRRAKRTAAADSHVASPSTPTTDT